MRKRFVIFAAFFYAVIFQLYAQEVLTSTESDYYDFLALQGMSTRPALNYHTLSDSVWNIGEAAEHPWQGLNLGTKRHLFGNVSMRIYGPELFTSYNTAAPYGQNDGALWQGKGFNTSLTGGIRFEGYGVELTFKPQLAFSQNVAFEYMLPEGMTGTNYADKAADYGYFWGTIDAPQRFGDESIFTYDWGDSEIRYTWKTLTIGFGTQAIWLGPAYLNPILHSNNAPTYPKLDIGLRRQPVTIPWVNWYIGDIEVRLWVGQLSESEYFDNDDSNDHNMINGLSFAYAPSFLPGLTLSANRICVVPWAWGNLKYLLPKSDNTVEDQKASFAVSYLLPQVGFEIFGELGVDDYVMDGFMGYVRHPFHTTVYTIGFKKAIKLFPQKQIYGELIFESNWMEMTQTFYYQGHLVHYSYYRHHLIKQGYTNKGQWLANASAPSGNSQYLKFVVYYQKGNSALTISRNNPDTNYVIIAGGHDNNYWANFIVGLDTTYYIAPSIRLYGGIISDLIIDRFYKRNSGGDGNVYTPNFSFQLGVKWVL